MEIMLKRLSNTATIPTSGTFESAGMDLYADIEKTVCIKPHETVMIPTNIALSIPDGYFGAIYPRSGLSAKRGLRLANCVGVIDSDYRGGIGVPMHNDSDKVEFIDPQERVAQLIIQKYKKVTFDEVLELPTSERGVGGFGSTGTK